VKFPLIRLQANVLTVLEVLKAALIGIILILVIQIQLNTGRQAHDANKLSAQTRQIAAQINHAVKVENANTNSQLAQVNAHLDCIVEFFSQPDRSQKAIADIDTCQLEATRGSTTVSSPQPISSTTTSLKTSQTPPADTKGQSSSQCDAACANTSITLPPMFLVHIQGNGLGPMLRNVLQ